MNFYQQRRIDYNHCGINLRFDRGPYQYGIVVGAADNYDTETGLWVR